MARHYRNTAVWAGALLPILLIMLSGCGGSKVPNSPPVTPSSNTPPPVSPTNHWGTSFEASEGFALGPIGGQKGWVIAYEGRPGQHVATVSDDRAATGQHSLKITAHDSYDDAWWMNYIGINAPENIIGDMPLNSVTFRLKVWRDPGETEYPAASGIMHPNTWFDQWCYYPTNRYADFGDAYQDGKMYAVLQNDGVRTTVGTGWDQIAGRFVEVVIHDDFVKNTRTVWYDGVRVATATILNSTRTYNSFTLGYQSQNPVGTSASLGKDIYIDDIDVNWEPAYN